MSRGAFLFSGIGLCVSSGSMFEGDLVASAGLAVAGFIMLFQAFKQA